MFELQCWESCYGNVPKNPKYPAWYLHVFYSKHDDCGDSSRLESFVDIRKLSFSIQLTSPEKYEGGELILYINNKEFIAPKAKGTIVFFQSNILHEVKPVKKGSRYALVSWVQGPNLR